MFGKCKVCLEKDIRISELKEQISYLRNILNPPPRIQKYELEQDIALSGGGDTIVIPSTDQEAEEQENERIRREQDEFFSGNYAETEY